MIEGLSHITFVVRDLEKMERMLVEVLDAKRVYDSGDDTFSLSREKFFLIGNVWIAIMKGEPLREQTYNHVAFKITDEDYEMYLKRVKEAGLAVEESRPRVEGEGRSIYFYDDDNHMFELHTGTLDTRLDRYTQG